MKPSLAPRALHVWHADLDRATDVGALSLAERDRAARFRFEVDGVRWGRARAILRDLLGGYLGCEPERIEFEFGAHGKPEVCGIDFNVSHAQGTALYAFAIENAVGVDVELAGRVPDPLGVAGGVLDRDDVARLGGLPPSAREAEFLRSWVRHEAALKCRGDRLGDPVQLEELSLLDLDVGPAAAAAVALERSVDAVSIWELAGPARPGG
jgi:4'-phosphopantetheinyl transferase